MPLPDKDLRWPPAELDALLPSWAEWSAWYSGDPEEIRNVYAHAAPRARSLGIIPATLNIARRLFWGESRTDLSKPPERKLHVPVAGDLCQASADLLLSEAPSVTPAKDVEDTTRERITALTGADWHAALISGAEHAAALGGCYLRVTWDKDTVPGRPFLTVIDLDAAVPEYRWGRLTALTVWQTLREDGGRVWRHLERHELDPDTGEGLIRHGLYEGTADHLGQLRPLTDHPVTAQVAESLTDPEGDLIRTGSPGLAVIPWANVTPNRRWRKHPLGRHVGRSDLDGLVDLLDALDEAYTSLMRDVRLGKAMLMVPRQMVTSNGPGQGVSFEQNEVYAPINAAPGAVGDARLTVEQVQFAIRVQEHEQTITLLWNALIRSAGYSAQTFGEGDVTAATATEVQARERRSVLSKGRKSRNLEPALQEALRKLLAVDAHIFNTGADPSAEVSIELASGVQEDPQHLAQTAALLQSAVAASVETRVKLVNPGKDDEWIEAEVARVVAQNALELTDPLRVGQDGADLDGSFPMEDPSQTPGGTPLP